MWGRKRLAGSDPLLLVAAAVCGLMILVAVFGPLLAPYDPNATNILAADLPPSPEHWLGTDSLGRDIYSRILYGARLSLLAPTIIVAVSTTLGVVLALTSSWVGGWFDSLVNKALNVLFAVPAILVAIVAVAAFGAGFWPPVIALSIIYTPYVSRVLKGAAAQERRRAYVEAFQLAGLSAWRINTRHILRNLQPLILAQATLNFGAALIDFGALSFLGLGVPAPTAEWGAMVSAGRSELLAGNAQQAMAAGTVIVLTVVAFNVLGERVSRRFGATR
ncbi:ABC transporter permease [Microbacterium sp. Root180]|nr:ABC transporter permease [Microbacterium sp. Root180]